MTHLVAIFSYQAEIYHLFFGSKNKKLMFKWQQRHLEIIGGAGNLYSIPKSGLLGKRIHGDRLSQMFF